MRRPGQQAAVMPSVGQGQPSRFLSLGQSALPPGGGGALKPPSRKQYVTGGSCIQGSTARSPEGTPRSAPEPPSPPRPLLLPQPASDAASARTVASEVRRMGVT